MTQAVIFTGGINHPFETSAPALAEILRGAGFATRVSFAIEETCADLRANPRALLVVHALRWTMTQHEKYAPDRAQWAFATSHDVRETIQAHVAHGAGLLALHTASICFDDWPGWPQLLGGGWQWGRSFHPPPAPVRMHLAPSHILTRGLGDFLVTDELYSEQQIAPGSEICGWLSPGTQTENAAQPAVWTHHYGKGRVVYDALGHDAESLRQPTHSRLIQRAALWASGHPQHIVEAA